MCVAVDGTGRVQKRSLVLQQSQAAQVALQFGGDAAAVGPGGTGAGARPGATSTSGTGGAPGVEVVGAGFQANSALSKVGPPQKQGSRPGIQKPILPYSCMFFVMPSNPYAAQVLERI